MTRPAPRLAAATAAGGVLALLLAVTGQEEVAISITLATVALTAAGVVVLALRRHHPGPGDRYAIATIARWAAAAALAVLLLGVALSAVRDQLLAVVWYGIAATAVVTCRWAAASGRPEDAPLTVRDRWTFWTLALSARRRRARSATPGGQHHDQPG
jgi:hypothetical protein